MGADEQEDDNERGGLSAGLLPVGFLPHPGENVKMAVIFGSIPDSTFFLFALADARAERARIEIFTHFEPLSMGFCGNKEFGSIFPGKAGDAHRS